MGKSKRRRPLNRDGKPCTYCARPMRIDNEEGTYPTREHVHPQSKGGKFTVWACYTCNHVKSDMTENKWAIYRGTHDHWWLVGPRARKARNWRPRPEEEQRRLWYPSQPLLTAE